MTGKSTPTGLDASPEAGSDGYIQAASKLMIEYTIWSKVQDAPVPALLRIMTHDYSIKVSQLYELFLKNLSQLLRKLKIMSNKVGGSSRVTNLPASESQACSLFPIITIISFGIMRIIGNNPSVIVPIILIFSEKQIVKVIKLNNENII